MTDALMNRIKAQLVRHEGLKLKPYRCTAGKLTIGIGRNLDNCGISHVICITHPFLKLCLLNRSNKFAVLVSVTIEASP